MIQTNDIESMLREISDDFIEESWEEELNINNGYRPPRQHDAVDLDDVDFDLDESELLINLQDND